LALATIATTAGMTESGPIAAQAIDVKIGFATINDPQHEIGKRLADRFNKDFGGKLSARVFPAGQLGSIGRMIEGMQLGTQEILIVPPGFFVGMNPAFQVPDAPGLFDDVMHAHRALTDPSFRNPYTELAVGKGVRALTLNVYGPTSFATLKPFRKLDDLKGLKIRVLATKIETELVKQFGATGVPMDYTEVLAALTNKTLDGVRSSVVVMGGSKFFTVTKSITLTNDGMIPSATWASESWLQKLPADVRAQVVKVTRDMDEECTKIAIEFDGKAEQLWKENGAEVLRLSDADQKEFMKRVAPLGDAYLGNHENEGVKKMYALLKASVEKHRKK
jgi:TRAP-type C4-dicarboxylate transport system substrate-binding protein